MQLIYFPIEILIVIAAGIFGVWLLVKILMGVGWAVGQAVRGVGSIIGRLGTFVCRMVSDALRIVGGVLTAAFLVPLILFNVAAGRWSTANHYGKALEREAVGVGQATYRVALGNVARLLGLTSLIDGIERRIPEAVARAPGPDRPRGRDAFEGYKVVGSLPSGGSGARLFLAEPDQTKRDQLARAGLTCPARVVIKSFSLADGSTLPQIVRESRALEAARKLGLVLEHELSGTDFHYVMPYVPGEDLGVVTQRLHAESGAEGLGDRQLDGTMAYVADLLQTLHRFHTHGLWHKDIKPNNIIVSGGRVHLVDLGLTTPLQSAMTLTTHGTEYFRDPELVRLALKGVKVHEVDGVKFDIYGAGAVLYSLIENSFPAHGSLSQIHKRCPDALRWIVRRAMADMNNRYGSALEMLADLRAVTSARNPFKVKPASLPSMSGDGRRMAGAVEGMAAADGGTIPGQPAGPTPRPSVLDGSAATSPKSRRARSAVDSVFRAIGVSVAALLILGAVFLTTSLDSSSTSVTRGPRSRALPPARSTVAVQTPPSLARVSPPAAGDRALRDAATRRPESSVLLVVDEAPRDAATRAAIESRLATLTEARFELVGVGREHDLDPDLLVDLVAGVRAKIGLGGIGADERTLLRNHLVERDPPVDGVLWLGAPARDGQLFSFSVLAAPGREADEADVRSLLDADR